MGPRSLRLFFLSNERISRNPQPPVVTDSRLGFYPILPPIPAEFCNGHIFTLKTTSVHLLTSKTDSLVVEGLGGRRGGRGFESLSDQKLKNFFFRGAVRSFELRTTPLCQYTSTNTKIRPESRLEPVTSNTKRRASTARLTSSFVPAPLSFVGSH